MNKVPPVEPCYNRQTKTSRRAWTISLRWQTGSSLSAMVHTSITPGDPRIPLQWKPVLVPNFPNHSLTRRTCNYRQSRPLRQPIQETNGTYIAGANSGNPKPAVALRKPTAASALAAYRVYVSRMYACMDVMTTTRPALKTDIPRFGTIQ